MRVVSAFSRLAMISVLPLTVAACSDDGGADGDGSAGGAPGTVVTPPGMPVQTAPGAMPAGTTPAGTTGTDTPVTGGPAPDQGTPPVVPPTGDGIPIEPPPVAGGEAPSPPPGDGCLQGGGDYLDQGPYGTATMDVSIGSSGMFTIFHPQPFDDNCRHPIVAWGNGTGVTGSGTYAFYNDHAASWGIVVVASHNSNVGSGEFHRAGIDYLLAQNEDPSSMFHQRLSPRAGTSGHSQGGMGANQGAGHPNVEAEVNVQGAFGGAPGGVAFLCLTGTADLNPAGCASSVRGASAPALYANWDGGDHFGTATVAGFIGADPGTLQYMRLYSAWFRCFLGDDGAACGLFQGGAGCSVCSDPGWAEIEMVNY
ncbi:MAG: hypothetical protein OXT09_32485 [Myxococcales bacterium]|nr:hypothetical protein [Myxococcales bacterium]